MVNEEDLLRVGDKIRLERGMKVYTEIPEMFVYGNKRHSKEICKTEIVIGQPKYFMQTSNINDVIQKLTKQGIRIRQKDIPKFEGVGTGWIFETTKYIGEYTIIQAENDRQEIESYHVFCEKNDNPQIKVDFYQTGFFIAKIKPDEIRPMK